MIRFDPKPKPQGFVDQVEVPGAALLAAKDGGRPRPLWRGFRSQLSDAFGALCAYGAMHEAVGTVDHFISVDEDRSRAYDWTNYRFSAAWINSSKQNLRSSQIIDPFEVDNAWFEILLPSLQLVLTDQVPPDERDRAQFVLDRLHLGHDERILRQRQAWFTMYEKGDLTLAGLEKLAPLIAAAVRKREGL